VRARGAGRSGLAAKDGTMIAGSQTLDVMAELGMPIRTVHTTGAEWVVVVRDDLEPDSEEAELLGLDDNRAAETGLNYDAAILTDMGERYDLSALFYPDELSAILEQAGTDIIALAPEAFKEYDENVETEYCCPKCAYTWSGKPK
jgi:hypothetical protein